MKTGDLVQGRFRLEDKLGAGGMGVVFRAADEHTGRTVAVKLLLADEDADLARARREAQLLAGLAHPGIVTHVADGLTPDGRLYLAMEWVDGITVAERIARNGFSLAEAVAVLRQVAGALGAAHDAGVLHRDVKPTNVLLAGGGTDLVKLIDFGIARATSAARSLTRTGTAIGTPGYMAPEQARGERALTAAVDVFGLGSMFYECATGRPAFSGAQRAAVLAKVLLADPPPFSGQCPEAPAALAALVTRMLDKDPARRPRDGGEVVALLDAIGAIPSGVRHVGGKLGDPTARVAAPTGHCMVMAARGLPDEPSAPIELTDAVRAALAAATAGGEVLDSGVLVAHLGGPVVDVARRAARCALGLRVALPDCAIAISAVESQVDEAADGGAELLTGVALASIFRGTVGEIAVDPRTAGLIAEDFVVASGVPPILRGERARQP